MRTSIDELIKAFDTNIGLRKLPLALREMQDSLDYLDRRRLEPNKDFQNAYYRLYDFLENEYKIIRRMV